MKKGYDEYVQKLDAVKYDKIYEAIKVINTDAAEYFLWVKLPVDDVRDLKIIEITQVEVSRNCECKPELDHAFYKRESNTWLRVTFAALDHAIGKHIYKMTLVDVKTDDVISLYFGYIIQKDGPEKPYIYMNKCTTNNNGGE